MKVAQVKNNKIAIDEIEEVKLGEKKGAIVKILGCGLCGSDIVKFKHALAQDGTVLGHEIVGIIEEINSDTSFKIGDKIVSSHHIPCFVSPHQKPVRPQSKNLHEVYACLYFLLRYECFPLPRCIGGCIPPCSPLLLRTLE